MISIVMMVFYWIILPFFCASLVLRLIRKYGKKAADPAITALFAQRPIEKKFYRALKRDASGLTFLGDFETQLEAVDQAYRGKEAAQKAGRKESFLVLNDKAEVYQEIDS